jgi:hypothetical protein
MIRHEHVTPKRNVKFRSRAMTIFLKGKLSPMQRGNTFAVAGGKSDE